MTPRKKAPKASSDDTNRAGWSYAHSLIEASLDPLVTISAEELITDINTATEKITGVSREKLIGNNFADYFTEPEKAHAGYLKVFEQGQVIDYPLAIRHTSGAVTYVLYNASVYRNEQGEVLGVFAAARDITERKRTEEALTDLQSLLNAIVDSTNTPLICTFFSLLPLLFFCIFNSHPLGYCLLFPFMPLIQHR